MACRSCHHQGLKPHSFHGSARLKPCPDTNQIITSCSRKCRNSSRRLSAGACGDRRLAHARKSRLKGECRQDCLPHKTDRTSARLKPCPDTNQIITSCSRKCRTSGRRLSAGACGDRRLAHARKSRLKGECRQDCLPHKTGRTSRKWPEAATSYLLDRKSTR